MTIIDRSMGHCRVHMHTRHAIAARRTGTRENGDSAMCVSKVCGAAWKALDGDGKEVWKNKAAALKNNEPVEA